MFEEINTNMDICLFPSALYNIKEYISLKLGGLVLKYRDDLEGVVLYVNNIQLNNNNDNNNLGYGKILNETPYIYININVTFGIFKPALQQIMVGRIVHQSQFKIALLLYELFNVTISIDLLPESFTFNELDQCWEVNNNDELKKLNGDDQIKFKIFNINYTKGLLNMEGEFIELIHYEEELIK